MQDFLEKFESDEESKCSTRFSLETSRKPLRLSMLSLFITLLSIEFVSGEKGRRELDLIFSGVVLFWAGEKRGGISNLPDFRCLVRLAREVMLFPVADEDMVIESIDDADGENMYALAWSS
jgi:hypothetical protein